MVTCWLLAVCASLVPALLPFVLGRTVFFALRLPTFCCHDPLAYFIGNFTLQRVILAVENAQESIYGRLCTLLWSWRSQRLLPPTEDEDLTITNSRVSPIVNKGHERSVWRLLRQVLRTGVVGCFLLPLCIGLAYNACLLLQPWPVAGVRENDSDSDTCPEQTESSASGGDLVSLLVQVVMRWQQDHTSLDTMASATLWPLVLKELMRTVLFGQLVVLGFIVLVLSRRLKTLLAAVGVSVLRADMSGPPTLSETREQEQYERARLDQHSVMKWYLWFWESGEEQLEEDQRRQGCSSWMEAVKQFEWDVDCFTAAFVRCSPGTVMQDHLMPAPRPVRTTVTTLESALVVHHMTEIVRRFNKLFIFSPQVCWFVQHILGTYVLALLPLALRMMYISDAGSAGAGLGGLHPMASSRCASSSLATAWSGETFCLELHLVLPLLTVCALVGWLDRVLGVGRHLVRGVTQMAAEVQQAIKEDSYLIGKELQNSVEVRSKQDKEGGQERRKGEARRGDGCRSALLIINASACSMYPLLPVFIIINVVLFILLFVDAHILQGLRHMASLDYSPVGLSTVD